MHNFLSDGFTDPFRHASYHDPAEKTTSLLYQSAVTDESAQGVIH